MLFVLIGLMAGGPVITLSPADMPHSVDLVEAIEAAPADATLILPAGHWDEVSVTIRRPLTVRGVGRETVISQTGFGFHDEDAVRAKFGEEYDREVAIIQDLIDRGVDGKEFAAAEVAFIRKFTSRPVFNVRGGSLTLDNLQVTNLGPDQRQGGSATAAVRTRGRVPASPRR